MACTLFARPLFIVLTLLLLAPAPVRAGDGDSLGLNVDVGFATAYLFRGFNVFQKDSQMDQHMLLAPGVTWSIMGTGLTVGYWGAFQLTGGNRQSVTDGGLGVEQDIYVKYAVALPYNLTLSFGLLDYLYPAADKDIMGASAPNYLEPSVALNYSNVVDVGVDVAYFLGLQDTPKIRGISYLYLHPYVSKSISFSSMMSLDLKFAYGFKLFQEGNDGASNIHDIALTAGLPIRITPMFYVIPSINAAWTDRPNDDFGDGFAVWGGVNVGLNF